MTEAHGRRPEEDHGHGREDGRPRRPRPAWSRSPASRSARPPSARSTWPTPTAPSRTAAAPRSGSSSTRSPRRPARSATGRRRRTARVLPDDIDRDVSYALQGVVKQGTGQNAQALGRPAAGKTGTATNADGNVSSSWFVGYTPQLATAVMYVRGDGNDNLNCKNKNGKNCDPGYLVPYFGAEYPDQDLDRRDADVARRRPGRAVPAAGERRGHQERPRSRCRRSPRSRRRRRTPTRKPSKTPTPTPDPDADPRHRRRRRPPHRGHRHPRVPVARSCVPATANGNGGGGGGPNGGESLALASRPPRG